MKIGIPCLVALTLLGAGFVPAAQPPAPPQEQTAAPGAYDIVFLSESRPLLVRVDVRVDGKPLEKVWGEFIDYLFKYADTDGDGVLSREEAERAPQPSYFSANFLFGGFNASGPTLKGADKSGKVTRAEFTAFYRKSGLAPFQIHAEAQKNNRPRGGMPFAMQTPSAAELNKALMKLLDTNKDGKLSRQELAAAPALFRKLDLDEDEVIIPKELLPDFTPFNLGFNAAYAQTGPAGPAAGNETVFLVSAVTTPRHVAQLLLGRYGAKKGKAAKRTLTRQDIGLDEESFAQLDRDGNGELDSEELARFLPRSPDLDFVIRIGEHKPGEAAVELVKCKGKDVRITRSVDTATLLFTGERVGVRVGEAKPRAQIGFFLRQALQAQFQQADKDNNGYLDEKEARSSTFARSFKMMDRDGDGKLYEKEVLAFFETVEDFQTRTAVSCVSLTFADGGHGLFDLFDADRDGRLSLREINAMVRLVDELDRDGDGAISQAEIPHSYLFRFDQGTGGEGNNPFAIFEALGMNSGPLPARGHGPLWFQKMDRNRDGDVSRREFLGSDELFRRIDSDGDGLISLQEAVRFDESLRKSRQPR